ncbi:MAG: YdeI/OmpD-associated family protein [Pirellulaceae bacterium]
MAKTRPVNVEAFLAGLDQWQSELTHLRELLLSTGMEEAIKWGTPVYSHAGKNVVGIAGFKSYFGLWFYQGALLNDPHGLLVNAREGTTNAQRQIRFHSSKQVKARLLRRYVIEAMALVEAGKEIKPNRNQPLEVPLELAAALKKTPKAARNFELMSKSCRREYAEYIASAKKDETKQRRLDKIMPMIVAGGGLNDRYRNC